MKVLLRPLEPKETDHELIWSLIGLAIMGGIVGYTRLLSPPPVRCVFHWLTGWPCLTCGATRALLALSQLRLAGALRLNPAAAAAWGFWIVYVPYGLAVCACRLPRVRFELSRRDWMVARVLVCAAIVLNWAWVIYDGR